MPLLSDTYHELHSLKSRQTKCLLRCDAQNTGKLAKSQEQHIYFDAKGERCLYFFLIRNARRWYRPGGLPISRCRGYAAAAGDAPLEIGQPGWAAHMAKSKSAGLGPGLGLGSGSWSDPAHCRFPCLLLSRMRLLNQE